MKNIQTGREIKVFEIGEGLCSTSSYVEIIEQDRSWVYASADSDGDYFAVLYEGVNQVARVLCESCLDDALSGLETYIQKMIERGDDRAILRSWHAPQVLGV